MCCLPVCLSVSPPDFSVLFSVLLLCCEQCSGVLPGLDLFYGCLCSFFSLGLFGSAPQAQGRGGTTSSAPLLCGEYRAEPTRYSCCSSLTLVPPHQSRPEIEIHPHSSWPGTTTTTSLLSHHSFLASAQEAVKTNFSAATLLS